MGATESGCRPAPFMRWLEPRKGLRRVVPGSNLWAYPEPTDFPQRSHCWEKTDRWRSHRQAQPRAHDFLHLLWRDELAAEAMRHGIGANARSTVGYLIGEMCWLMSGREIAQAVCRQLRARTFVEADAPVTEPEAAE